MSIYIIILLATCNLHFLGAGGDPGGAGRGRLRLHGLRRVLRDDDDQARVNTNILATYQIIIWKQIRFPFQEQIKLF